MQIMKGLFGFALFIICVESAILDLKEDSSTPKRPSAMAEPASGKIRQLTNPFYVQHFLKRTFKKQSKMNKGLFDLEIYLICGH